MILETKICQIFDKHLPTTRYTGSVTALEQIDHKIAALENQKKRLIEIAQMLYGGIMTADMLYSVKGMEAFKELDREVREMENKK